MEFIATYAGFLLEKSFKGMIVDYCSLKQKAIVFYYRGSDMLGECAPFPSRKTVI